MSSGGVERVPLFSGYLFLAFALPAKQLIDPGLHLVRAIDVERLGLTSLPRALRTVLGLTRLPPVAWVGGGLAAVGLSLVDGANHLACLGLRARIVATPPGAAETDAVWERLRTQLDLSPSRCGADMEWRYAGQRPGRYEFMCGMSMLRGVVIAEPAGSSK